MYLNTILNMRRAHVLFTCISAGKTSPAVWGVFTHQTSPPFPVSAFPFLLLPAFLTIFLSSVAWLLIEGQSYVSAHYLLNLASTLTFAAFVIHGAALTGTSAASNDKSLQKRSKYNSADCLSPPWSVCTPTLDRSSFQHRAGTCRLRLNDFLLLMIIICKGSAPTAITKCGLSSRKKHSEPTKAETLELGHKTLFYVSKLPLLHTMQMGFLYTLIFPGCTYSTLQSATTLTPVKLNKSLCTGERTEPMINNGKNNSSVCKASSKTKVRNVLWQ